MEKGGTWMCRMLRAAADHVVLLPIVPRAGDGTQPTHQAAHMPQIVAVANIAHLHG